MQKLLLLPHRILGVEFGVHDSRLSLFGLSPSASQCFTAELLACLGNISRN
jgi:hypothetical protein